MIRNAFNGGELSPELQMRGDLEVYQRGCSVVENFDVGQAGGVSRRKGFRYFAGAMGADSRIFVYDASEDDRYLVELNTERIRVYHRSGAIEWEGAVSLSAAAVVKMRTLQINSVLLFLSNFSPVMQLTQNSDREWNWEQWSYKTPPWRHKEYREFPIKVSKPTKDNNAYHVEWHPDERADETTYDDGDILRVSYTTEAQEIKSTAKDMLDAINRKENEGFLTQSARVSAGTKLAVRRTPRVAVYSCIETFDKDVFVNGLIDPENYHGNFTLSSDTSSYDLSVSELTKDLTIEKGKKLRFETGYWDLFTCVSSFDGASDFESGKNNPEDYPGHFARGMMLGSAPCKGAWRFYCSGTWYGSYEVRASYDGSGSDEADWEYRGEAWSTNAAPSNAPIGGDESAEECYVSLWLTRARAYGGTLGEKCFPSDICGNCLVVNSYKHDMQLQVRSLRDEHGALVDRKFERVEKIQTEWSGAIESIDWSWSAFSSRYGWPRVACVYNQRLVLAGTIAQPMTIWASQTDDLDNFDIIDQDNGALALTLSGETMEPIRWLEGQNSRIVLGTSRGEYVVQAANGGVLSYANARVDRHGYNGAADVNHIQCEDKVIYVGRGASSVKQYGYDYAQDAYLSADLTVFAGHVLADGGGVVDGCVIKQPHTKAVFVLGNGRLALMTYNSMHQVNAWHRYVTEGEFLAVCAMLNDSMGDSLYALVRRTHDKGTEWESASVSIEVMDDDSGYTDGLQGFDYTSTLLTNALTVTNKGNAKQAPDAVMVYLAEATLAKGVEVTVDGGRTWAPTGKAPSLTLPVGWHEWDGFTRPDYTVEVGFRKRGAEGFRVLALQG